VRTLKENYILYLNIAPTPDRFKNCFPSSVRRMRTPQQSEDFEGKLYFIS